MLDLLGFAALFDTTALTYAVICLGLNVQRGQAGLFNVGVAGFVAIGAYPSAILTTPPGGHLGGFGLPIAVGWLGAMLVAAASSAAVGALTLRLKAGYLAITTFGVAVTVQLACLNAQGVTGGPFGIGFIPRPFASLVDHPVLFSLLDFGLVVAVAASLYAGLERLASSPWGRVLRGIRDDEVAVEALGRSVTAFSLQAHAIGFIAPDDFLPAPTFQVWTMLIIGGSGSNAGAVLGALLVWGIWSGSGAAVTALVPAEFQARAAAMQLVAIGVALSGMLVWRPGGVLGFRRAKGAATATSTPA